MTDCALRRSAFDDVSGLGVPAAKTLYAVDGEGRRYPGAMERTIPLAMPSDRTFDIGSQHRHAD